MIKRRKMFGIVAGAVLAMTAGTDAGLAKEFIAPPVTGHVHASTLLPLRDGGYLAAWFEGTKESNPDVAIKGAFRRNGRWSEKRVLAKVNPDSPHWNPVLRRADDGRISLYFKVGRNCSDWRTYLIESKDEGATWSEPRELVFGEVRGGRGPVRNKCLRLKSGRWLAPASREIGNWRAFIDRSDDDGHTWMASDPIRMPDPDGKDGVIQPTLWLAPDGRVRAYMRSNTGLIWETESADDGVTWAPARKTALPNNNSGIDLVKASDGCLYLVMNTASGNWSSRSELEIWRSPDEGATWKPWQVLERERTGEFSYPCILEPVPGKLAVTYTWKRQRIAFVELRLPERNSGSVNAVRADEPVLGGYAGSLELPGPEILLQPCLRPNNWSVRHALEDNFTAPVKGAHAFYILPDKDQNARISGMARFQSTADGGVAAAWTMNPDGAEARVIVETALRLPQWEGGALETDAGTERIADARPFGQIFDKDVRRLAVKDAEGKAHLRMVFPRPVRVRLFKERDWGLVKFDLRISFGQVEGANRLDATIYAGEGVPCAFREEGPLEITAGKDWIPLQAGFDVKEGSALDFSGFRGTDLPAGKYGWTVAKDGRFEFEGRPGVPVRFYGINICSDANSPSPADARKFASILRRLGYNAIRFHHHEYSLVKHDPAQGSTELDPEAMARFDALVAACIENGIYLTTDLFVSRSPISYRSLGIDRDGEVPMTEFKCLVQVHEGAYSNYTAFARNFLAHVNPHTGRRYADEPALALLSFVNEGNMMSVRWSAQSKGLVRKMSNAEAAECEVKFAKRMTAFVRGLGYRGLLTNMNNFFWHDDPAGEKVRVEEFQYSDDHFYVDHPRFIGREWRLPSSCPNTNPLKGTDLGTQRLASTRPWGLPFTITEYNFSAPGRFRGVGGVLTGAMGARQDWGGLLRFAWTHGKYGLTHAKEIGYFDMSGDPLGLAAERASICLFLRGDMAPAEKSAVFLLPPAKANEPGSLSPYWACDWAAWRLKLGTCVADRAPDGVQTIATYPAAPDAAAIARLKAEPERGIAVDPVRGSFTIDTPRTAGGFAERGRITAGPLVVELEDAPATVWVSSLDGAPIASSRRLLLTHLTDVQNTHVRYADAGKRILLGWGGLPHLMQAGCAQVALSVGNSSGQNRAGTGWKVWALAADGTRLREVACRWIDGKLGFTAKVAADSSAATWLYELVAGD